ncbi:hypothetical protein PT281_02615 [Lactobacillus sp. ESL0701]|uniref:hypothetical protein n=1 Tax=Lactobacillus sp. ESL0701 TaxID=2983217 RepID=UPI0023F818C4|nr:hypothetical protein [Lactobacillus sp. ESL0701]MDF7672181.1 hypothetical protein [Lactobacillus sp. ESL0701]
MKYYNQDYFPDKSDYQCPPKDAIKYEGMIYRFSKKSDKTDKEDWISVAKRGRKYEEWKFDNDYTKMCQSSGYSCYLSEQQARDAYNEMTKGNRGLKRKFRSFYSLHVNKLDGVILDTSNPEKGYRHFTFWLNYKSNIVEQNFSVTKW